MFARSSSWTGSPQALQTWEDNVDRVAAMIRGLPGVAGAMFFINRGDGEAMTLTLWKTRKLLWPVTRALRSVDRQRSRPPGRVGRARTLRSRRQVLGWIEHGKKPPWPAGQRSRT